MRILITGSQGMLGQDMAEALQQKHDLVLAGKKELDITNSEQAKHFINQEKPNLIINCAAYTLVDKCEEEADLAYRVNAIGPKNLALIAHEKNMPIVQISSDYVFDGEKKSSYQEDDHKNPISIYGKSKSLAEEYIITQTNQYYIVRTSWLFGQNGNNFIKTMLKLAETRDQINVVNDQFGSPTYTKDLAEAIANLIEKPRYGIYHITNSQYTNWYEYAKYIFMVANKKVLVKPISSEQFNRPAPRPQFSVLENKMWQLAGLPLLRSYKEAVKAYIENHIKSGDC